MNIKDLKVLLLVSSVIALFPTMTSANVVLNGHWDNYTLGTGGEWYLSYEKNAEETLFSLDFNGDFLGNGIDPDALIFSGVTKKKGNTTFNIVGHNDFGDVTAKINQTGQFKFKASDVPSSIIESVVLKGQLTEDSFDFLYDVYFEEGALLAPVFQMPDLEPHSSGLIMTMDVLQPELASVPLPSTFLLFLSSLGLVLKYRKIDDSL